MSATLTVKEIGSLLQGKSVTVGKNVLTMNFGTQPAKRGRPKGAAAAPAKVGRPKGSKNIVKAAAPKVTGKGRGRPVTEHTLRARDIEETLAAAGPAGTAIAFRAIFKAVKPSGISRAQLVKMIHGLCAAGGPLKRTKGGFALTAGIKGVQKNNFPLRRAGRPANGTAKRGPGRPKGSKNVVAAPKLNEDGTPKRGPGRPKGSKNVVVAPEVASPLDNIVAAAETAAPATEQQAAG